MSITNVITGILGLERIDSFQADVIRGLSCIVKLDSQSSWE